MDHGSLLEQSRGWSEAAVSPLLLLQLQDGSSSLATNAIVRYSTLFRRPFFLN
jgi:hypothetical protein